MVRYPRLLDSNMNEVRRIVPQSCSLTLSATPLSTSSLRLNRGEKLPERCWVEFYSPSGSVGYFRARTPNDGYGDTDSSVEFEHGVTELGDYIIKQEIKEEIAFNTAMSKVFYGDDPSSPTNYLGSKWQLGTISYTDTVAVDLDHDNVLESILKLVEQTPYILTFDFSTTPWTLGVSTVDAEVSAEGRLSRNVISAQVKQDDSELATKVWAKYAAKVNKQRKILWVSVQDNDSIAKYGLVEKALTEEYDSQTKANAEALKHLNKKKRPKFSVSITGQDLYAITGEPLDELRNGKKYRFAVEGESEPLEEVINSITYNDLYANENDVTVNLSEEDDFLIKSINEASKASNSSKKNKNELKKIEYEFSDEDGKLRSYVYMDHERLRLQFDNEISGLRSELTLTARELRVEFEDDIYSLRSEFEITASHLRTEFIDEANSLRSEFEITASHLRSEFNDEYLSLHSEFEVTASHMRSEYTSEISSVRTLVQQTASSWSAKLSDVVDSSGNVTAASIALAINAQGQAGTKISGAWVEIDATNHTTISDVLSIDTTGSSSYVAIKASNVWVGTNVLHTVQMASGAVTADSYSYRDSTTGTVKSGLMDVSKNDNTGTVTITRFDGTSVSFNRAASSLSGSWGGTNNTFPLTVTDGFNNYKIDFTTSGNANVKLMLDTNGSVTKGSGAAVNVPLKVQTYVSGSPPTLTTRYSTTLNNISVSGLLQSKTVSASNSQNVTVTPDSDKIGLSSVTVSKINTQAKVVSPSLSSQVILPDSGYSYLTSVTINSAQSIYNDGLAAAWINYVPGPPYSKTVQGTIAAGRWVYPGTSGNMWWTAAPWFAYSDTEGSNHQGILGGHKYIKLVTLDANGAVSDSMYGNATWEIPQSGSSYTKYTFSKTRTQSSDGYHYTFSIGTGWQTPFGASGGTYDLYKKN